jgi:hypothetical protein
LLFGQDPAVGYALVRLLCVGGHWNKSNRYRTYEVGTNPWPQYPRPLLQRSQWQTLNGVWTYQNASSKSDVNNPPVGQTLAQSVLVPFCLESGLSGAYNRNVCKEKCLLSLQASKGDLCCTAGTLHRLLCLRTGLAIVSCSTSGLWTTKQQFLSMARRRDSTAAAIMRSQWISRATLLMARTSCMSEKIITHGLIILTPGNAGSSLLSTLQIRIVSQPSKHHRRHQAFVLTKLFSIRHSHRQANLESIAHLLHSLQWYLAKRLDRVSPLNLRD